MTKKWQEPKNVLEGFKRLNANNNGLRNVMLDVVNKDNRKLIKWLKDEMVAIEDACEAECIVYKNELKRLKDTYEPSNLPSEPTHG